MRNVLQRFAMVGVLVVLGGCGGSGQAGSPAAEAPAGATAAPVEPADGAASGEAGTDGAASAEAQPAPTNAEPPSGGGTAVGACGLVSDEELGGILGASVKATELPGLQGLGDTCDIQSADGAPLAATVLTRNALPLLYEAFAADAGSTGVPGIGEKAAYNPTQAILIVYSNNSVLTVAVFDDGSADEAARFELMKHIATIAAGRM